MRQRLVNRNGKLHIDTTIKNRRIRFSTGLVYNKENRQSVMAHFCDYVSDYLAQNSQILENSPSHVVDEIIESGDVTTLERVGTKNAKIRRLARQIAKTKNIDSITSMLQDFESKKDIQVIDDTKLSDYSNLLLHTYTHLKPNTYKAIKTSLKRLLTIFGDRVVCTIGSKDIEELQRELAIREYSKSTISLTTFALNEILRLAYNDGVIDQIPQAIKKIKAKVQKKENKPFSLNEVKSILSVAKTMDITTYCYLKIAFFTGARKGEILALKWQDIDFTNNKINIRATIGDYEEGTPKTASSFRIIDMLPPVKEALELLKSQKMKPTYYVFLKHDKQATKVERSIQTRYKKALRNLGLEERTIYTTRHTFASIMLQQKENPMWVGCKMLGHKNLNMTYQVYAKYLDNENEQRAIFLNNIKEQL
ncbi:tyrosine-type recombinase/integrase [Helicobacter sp. WB40]|uniref:tyrosine-type recombinase/integrase n=1 Tax=Helicobacter sp. WB40 TaxID=3004130 RepID=UPI0022EBB72D|nr:site-specific integrase [Helicobacter sp. WB40]MDA3966651.1 site-specific integrase [Helicobacter sp. WB40]